MGSKLCIPKIDELKRKILEEAHKYTYFVLLGATKMYQDLKQLYWLDRMKKDLADYVSLYLVCQQVKAKHQCNTPSITK